MFVAPKINVFYEKKTFRIQFNTDLFNAISSSFIAHTIIQKCFF